MVGPVARGAKRPTVVVGMSGGVDSSVAALLLKEQGYQVVGLFMKNWDDDDGTEYCTAAADLLDADQVCHRLGIELHTVSFAAQYRENVFAEFLYEYSAGRTPNPDVLCNREIKFKQFVDHASSLGADLIATGHYARLQRQPDGSTRLAKGVDADKDQTYFLQAVPSEKLSRCLFPLGELRKSQVRAIAREAGFLNHRKKDSTGICFIGERRFADFLARYLPAQPGPIRDACGATVGCHRGLAYYTIGQRQGLGIGGLAGRQEAPWFVLDKDIASNTLVVTQQPDQLLGNWLSVTDLNWLMPEPALPLRAAAKIRYRQPDQPCLVRPRADGTLGVAFDRPQRAITPGQYACFYQGEVCIGGGVIQTRDALPALSSTPLVALAA
ncbi:MAG TPA: tRNA 2-thiouridine(34) synthase MnmA [Pseudomonadales bacterium]